MVTISALFAGITAQRNDACTAALTVNEVDVVLEAGRYTRYVPSIAAGALRPSR